MPYFRLPGCSNSDYRNKIRGTIKREISLVSEAEIKKEGMDSENSPWWRQTIKESHWQTYSNACMNEGLFHRSPGYNALHWNFYAEAFLPIGKFIAILWLQEPHYLQSLLVTLRAKLSGAVYCYRSCLCVALWLLCLWVGYHDNAKLCASIFTKLGLYRWR